MPRLHELNRLWPWMVRYMAILVFNFALIVVVQTIANANLRSTLTKLSFLLLMGTIIVSYIHKYSFENKLKRRLRHEGFLVCPGCLFSLRTQSLQCPECGEVVDREDLKGRWERMMGMRL